jgi:lipopolysaccharide/colanic/teichoic acid biosynthesis glycosyltransferase
MLISEVDVHENEPLRIVVTGATGFIGRQLVPRLMGSGADLLLVGREPERLRATWPGIRSCGYGDLSSQATGYDLLVHLAVMNSSTRATREDFERINVELLLDVACSARDAGITRFLNVSSVHALDERNTSDYARTKRVGDERLRNDSDCLKITTMYLPLVYGDRWNGRAAFLNHLPRPVAGCIFHVLAAFKPTLHVDKLASRILSFQRDTVDDLVILTDEQDGNRVFGWIKRLVDVTFAVTVLAGFWWLLLALWLLIRLESPGSGLFVQERIGKGGRRFRCLKFRTMREGTMQAGTHEVSPAAVTRVGRFLRRTKLDELPQVWNILCNEVSLIGPRPCLPVQTRLIEARRARGVLKLLPGISGLAQINGVDMSTPDELARWDAQYMALRSLLLDFSIVFATGLGRGHGDPLQGA